MFVNYISVYIGTVCVECIDYCVLSIIHFNIYYYNNINYVKISAMIL